MLILHADLSPQYSSREALPPVTHDDLISGNRDIIIKA